MPGIHVFARMRRRKLALARVSKSFDAGTRTSL
jgi:hypothetical protein